MYKNGFIRTLDVLGNICNGSIYFSICDVINLEINLIVSKFIISQNWKQKSAMHILPNISVSKGNQTMKLCQLIQYNMRNIFLEKLCTNVVKKL